AFVGGQRQFQVQAFPFRMTPENMARHRNNPNMAFWRMLKEGHDHFEVTRVPPKVDVCAAQYVFNAESKSGGRLNPNAACPELDVPEPIRVAVADKIARDEAKFALIAAKLDGQAATAVAAAESGPMTPIPASAYAAAPAGQPSAPMSLQQAAAVQPEAPAGGPDSVVAGAYAPAQEPQPQQAGFFGRLLKSLW
ncbi:MAG TPA: hypothetical protein VHG92_14305, partial [Afifellaceae bacterium]|nr:hypothetical protein [Afifellaceae bacterium]